MSILIFAASLGFAATPSPATTKTAWYECLEAYAQVAMFSKKSTARVVLEAMSVCSDERRLYQLAVFRERSDGSFFAERIADEDLAAQRHTAKFTNRYRPK